MVIPAGQQHEATGAAAAQKATGAAAHMRPQGQVWWFKFTVQSTQECRALAPPPPFCLCTHAPQSSTTGAGVVQMNCPDRIFVLQVPSTVPNVLPVLPVLPPLACTVDLVPPALRDEECITRLVGGGAAQGRGLGRRALGAEVCGWRRALGSGMPLCVGGAEVRGEVLRSGVNGASPAEWQGGQGRRKHRAWGHCVQRCGGH